MGGLEQRVRELTARAVAGEPGVRGAGPGAEPPGDSQAEGDRILAAAMAGIQEALLEIARAVDELNGN